MTFLELWDRYEDLTKHAVLSYIINKYISKTGNFCCLDSPGVEARWRVHWSSGRRRYALRAAMFSAVSRAGKRGRLCASYLTLHSRHWSGQPAGTGWLQHAHCGINILIYIKLHNLHFRLIWIMCDYTETCYCIIQDIDEVQVNYPGMLEVMSDLQGKLCVF